MFQGLETLTTTTARCNGVSGVWETRQKGYWACYNEALKACEVRNMSSLGGKKNIVPGGMGESSPFLMLSRGGGEKSIAP